VTARLAADSCVAAAQVGNGPVEGTFPLATVSEGA
jgi:hypothetical protein